MRQSQLRKILTRLMDDAEWRSTAAGKLGSLMVDFDIPLDDIAAHLQADRSTVYRWLTGSRVAVKPRFQARIDGLIAASHLLFQEQFRPRKWAKCLELAVADHQNAK